MLSALQRRMVVRCDADGCSTFDGGMQCTGRDPIRPADETTSSQTLSTLTTVFVAFYRNLHEFIVDTNKSSIRTLHHMLRGYQQYHNIVPLAQERIRTLYQFCSELVIGQIMLPSATKPGRLQFIIFPRCFMARIECRRPTHREVNGIRHGGMVLFPAAGTGFSWSGGATLESECRELNDTEHSNITGSASFRYRSVVVYCEELLSK
jgi:hypothetical protein